MKRITLLVMMTLLVSFSVSPVRGYRWFWAKDIFNWGTETAYDLAIILDSKVSIDWHYDGYPTHRFNKFACFPIGSYTFLHWTNPSNPIPIGDIVHVGICGSGSSPKIIDMFWTDEFGSRLPKSVVWNATSRTRYEDGEAIVCMANIIKIDAADGEGWASPRPVFVHDLRFVILDEPVPLEELNNENVELNESMNPLLPEVVLEYENEIEIPLPVNPLPGEFIIVRWDNLADAVEGSDLTDARDWMEFEVTEEDLSQSGM